MKKYIVEGMSCAACQARVEKAVSKVDGVKSCSVSLLTNSMGVEGSASDSDIIKAVVDAGYNARVLDKKNSDKDRLDSEDTLKDTETPKLKRRLILSAFFLIILMYITMGHNMINLPLPKFLLHNHIGLAIIQMVLAIVVMVINSKFFINGFNSLMHLAPNMDTLVALGSSVSFAWSFYILIKMTVFVTNGVPNSDLMDLYHNDLYFESAAMIPALITIGKMLESLSKGRTTSALKSLMKLRPKTATIINGDVETIIDIDNLNVQDIFIVKPGESIPADGVVVDGMSAVNESALTGESIPVDKGVGDEVHAGTINESGVMKCKTTKVGDDTTISQIINMVSDAAATKAPIARIADKVSGVFVPVVIAIACVVILGWIINGQNLSFAIARGISVLVISCPCALGLATPVAIMVGNGNGAKNGVLFKTSEALEMLGRVKTIAFDKTGTITNGKPEVTDIYNIDASRDELISFAYAMEKNSEHPLAKAIINYVDVNGFKDKLTKCEITDFRALPGNGVEAKISGSLSHAGSFSFISCISSINNELKSKIEELSGMGKTPLLFERDKKIIGVIAVADTVKDDSVGAINDLKRLGIETVMLTGDNIRTANAIAKLVNIDAVKADVLPSDKEKAVISLQENGRVAMVGDGINDAVALTRADVGIAIGAGTDVAVDSADVVLMNNRLSDVAFAVGLSKATLKNIYENLFWAFFYNAICIPLAAGLFPYKMNPMVGAAAMSLSSFTVCMNALRLNLFKWHGKSHAMSYDNGKRDSLNLEKSKKDITDKQKSEVGG